MNKFKRLTLLSATVMFGMASPAFAQMAVIDSSNLAQALETARNTLKQIEEAQRLYSAVNGISDVGSIAGVLNSDMVKRGLPSDIQETMRLASADLSELGSVGDRAQEILSGRGLSVNGLDGVLASAQKLAARDQAIAEVQLEAADQTAKGISELKDRLLTAETAKEVADLQARASLEMAQLQNQANQRQALKDAQLAADKLAVAEYNKAQKEANDRARSEGRFLPVVGN